MEYTWLPPPFCLHNNLVEEGRQRKTNWPRVIYSGQGVKYEAGYLWLYSNTNNYTTLFTLSK